MAATDSFEYIGTVDILVAGRISFDAILDGGIRSGDDLGATWTVMMDPKVIIDPDAMFDLDGTLTRYADAYELQFSEFVDPFDPGVPTLKRTWGTIKSLYGSPR